MFRKKKIKDKPVSGGRGDGDKPEQPPRRKGPRVGVRIVLAIAVAAAAGAGMVRLRQRLFASPAYARRFARVRLAKPPADLPADIVRAVLADLEAAVKDRNVFDDRLARDVYLAAVENAWIAKVRRVTKEHDGRVVVDVEFRRPFALVATENDPGVFHVVDSEGVVIPLRADRIRPGSLLMIGGVATLSPRAGEKWDVPDLADGLRLCNLLKDRPYRDQITSIDVSNHNGRHDGSGSHILFFAQVGRGRRTCIRFGRFPVDDQDVCRSPKEKLAMLDDFARRNSGRIAGVKEWIDIRYDNIHVSRR